MFFWSILACANGFWSDSPFRDIPHAGPEPGFPLDGAHQTVRCDGCHTSGDMEAEVPSTCEGCHEADQPPIHAFDRGCGDCHTTESWLDVEAQG